MSELTIGQKSCMTEDLDEAIRHFLSHDKIGVLMVAVSGKKQINICNLYRGDTDNYPGWEYIIKRPRDESYMFVAGGPLNFNEIKQHMERKALLAIENGKIYLDEVPSIQYHYY